MIIRTSPRRSYTAIPNAIFRDKNLSLDTKGLLAYLLSLPANWEIKPAVLAKSLSPKDGRPLGRDRLRRMFAEAQAAGYMVRSEKQAHRVDGDWGSYVYIVGPEPALVADEAQAHGIDVTFSAQSALASTRTASTPKPHTPIEEDINNRKRPIPPKPPSCRAAPPQAAIREEEGQTFSDFRNAYPFEPWMSLTAAERIWAHLDSFDRLHAIVGAEFYAKDCRDKQRRVQNAKTWLRERTWEGHFPSNRRSTGATLTPYSEPWHAERTRRLRSLAYRASHPAIRTGGEKRPDARCVPGGASGLTHAVRVLLGHLGA
jgi:hypothetical protein